METVTIEKSGLEVDQSNETSIGKAPFGDRFSAALVDGIMINLPTNIILFILLAPIVVQSKSILVKLFIIIIELSIQLIVNIGYYGVFAYSRKGQTLGKKWNKIKVVNLDSTNLSLGKFLWRAFAARGIPIVGILFFGNLANAWFLTCLLALGKNGYALHDRMAATQVVKIK